MEYQGNDSTLKFTVQHLAGRTVPVGFAVYQRQREWEYWSRGELVYGDSVKDLRLKKEPLIDTLLAKGVLLQTVEPEGIVPGRPPEQIAVASVLAILRAPGDEPAVMDGGDAISALLDRRNRAVKQALDGITLRSLAMDDPFNH